MVPWENCLYAVFADFFRAREKSSKRRGSMEIEPIHEKNTFGELAEVNLEI